MENVSDFLCVQRVKAGDVQAFAMIVSKYGEMVFTVVRKIVENREDAEDITQEVFIKAFKSLDRFREESAFSTWLYRIAYNTCISELRQRKSRFFPVKDNLLVDNDFAANDDEEDVEIKLQHLEKALKKLPPDEAFLITLHYMDEQSVENISIICNMSVSNVKVKLHRIRKKLSVEINKLMCDEQE
ncbi:MAG: RNA polymerase sigma factor [Prevotellaceae bacterium]|jgi:RNA polymerase sigma-70 factor (ECF subfamily)|nr:RNA polymerase sigma factor [Prevotellaceae bacterium]